MFWKKSEDKEYILKAENISSRIDELVSWVADIEKIVKNNQKPKTADSMIKDIHSSHKAIHEATDKIKEFIRDAEFALEMERENTREKKLIKSKNEQIKVLQANLSKIVTIKDAEIAKLKACAESAVMGMARVRAENKND